MHSHLFVLLFSWDSELLHFSFRFRDKAQYLYIEKNTWKNARKSSVVAKLVEAMKNRQHLGFH